MIKQQQALLKSENVTLHFTDAAIKEIARVAEEVNTSIDNIGARRLHTILERIVEDISFEAPENARAAGDAGLSIVVDAENVTEKIEDLLKKQDLSKYVL
jgi:ATP-dependent HslUV protease ATP-binding subunit HslU